MVRRPSKRSRSPSTAGREASGHEGKPHKKDRRGPGRKRPASAVPGRLTEDEEERLGRLVSADVWTDKVRQGRGAAVCTMGELEFAGVLAQYERSGEFQARLSCKSAEGSPYKLSLFFNGSYARELHEIIASPSESKLRLYLSGLGAEIPAEGAKATHVSFVQNKVALRVLPTELEPKGRWYEYIGKAEHVPSAPPGASKNVPSEAEGSEGAASSAVKLSLSQQSSFSNGVDDTNGDGAGWFNTPPEEAGSTARPQKTVAEHNKGKAHAENIVSGQQRQQQQQLQKSAESSNGAKSRDEKPKPPKQVPKRKGPVPQPQMLGKYQYTPLALVRDGMLVNVIGALVTDRSPRRASGGTGDMTLNIGLRDISSDSGKTGDGTTFTVNLFSKHLVDLPHPLRPGEVILLRKIRVRAFQGRGQGVGYSGKFDWAVFDPFSGSMRQSVMHLSISDAEAAYMKEVGKWYVSETGMTSGAVGRSEVGGPSREGLDHVVGRATLTLDQIGENQFFDCVAEVVKVFEHSSPPDLYVTDYTSHPLFYARNNAHLGIGDEELARLREERGDHGGGQVFQISLWDEQAEAALYLSVGKFVHLRNVRAKRNPNGMLCGTMHGERDGMLPRCNVTKIRPDDESLTGLLERRTKYYERRFAMEEEAFAEVAERSIAATPAPAGSGTSSSRQAADVDPDSTDAVPSVKREEPAGTDHSGGTSPSKLRRTQSERDVEQSPDLALRSSKRGASARNPALPESPTRAESDDEPRSRPTQGGTASGNQKDLSRSQQSLPQPGQVLRQIQAPESSIPSPTPSLKVTRPPPAAPLSSTPGTALLADSGDWPPSNARSPPVTCHFAHIPVTPISKLVSTSRVPGKYHLRARVLDVKPAKLDEWVRAECGLCGKTLPVEHNFCVPCGDEEGEHIQYRFLFALLVEDEKESGATIPVIVCGEDALAFLPNLDPQKCRRSASGTRKLRRRLAPILGPSLAYRDAPSEAPRKLGLDLDLNLNLGPGETSPPGPAFDLCVRSYELRERDGTVDRKYRLFGTTVGREEGRADAAG